MAQVLSRLYTPHIFPIRHFYRYSCQIANAIKETEYIFLLLFPLLLFFLAFAFALFHSLLLFCSNFFFYLSRTLPDINPNQFHDLLLARIHVFGFTSSLTKINHTSCCIFCLFVVVFLFIYLFFCGEVLW